MAVGPNTSDSNSLDSVLAVAAQQVTVGTADIPLSGVFLAGYCKRVFVNIASGSAVVFVQRAQDAAAIGYTLTPQWPIIDGRIILIGGTTNHGTATSGAVLNLEI
jgi:hypothetical protein